MHIFRTKDTDLLEGNDGGKNSRQMLTQSILYCGQKSGDVQRIEENLMQTGP